MVVENEHEIEMQCTVSVYEINEAILNLGECMSQLPPHHRINVDTNQIALLIPENKHPKMEPFETLAKEFLDCLFMKEPLRKLCPS